VWIETMMKPGGNAPAVRHPLRSERVWIETYRVVIDGAEWKVTRSDQSGCGLKP